MENASHKEKKKFSESYDPTHLCQLCFSDCPRMFQIDKYDWKMIRHICFDYSTFKIIIKDGIGDNVICCGSCITSYSCWLINCRYHAKFKHKINKILDFFVDFIIKDIDIKITCKEKCFVSFGIFRKNFSEKGFSYT